MDPNTTLDEIRSAVARSHTVSGEEARIEYARLVEMFQNLDHWLTAGGVSA